MKRHSWAIAALLSISFQSHAQEVWTVGPMFNLNFGGGKRTMSFAIEAAYWNVKGFPHSVDFAIEFDKGKLRLYSEAQTGIGITGISLGPVLEFNIRESKTRVGIQGTCWLNYILGVDYRIRFIDRQKFHCLGLYGKLPVASSGLESGGKSHHGFDWDDWD